MKVALSTQTIVFCGFSLKDPDFLKILQLLKKELKNYSPRFFLVTLDKEIDKQQLMEYNIQPIFTNATFFIHKLRMKLIRAKALIDDKIFTEVYQKKTELDYYHSKIDEDNLISSSPSSIYTLAYQDGLLHAFDRTLRRKITGEYSDYCHVCSLISSYTKIIEKQKQHKNYPDLAYTKGYLIGLKFLVAQKKVRSQVPLFYLYDDFIFGDYDDYIDILKNNRIFNKPADDLAKKIIRKYNIRENGLTFHHIPFL